MRRLLLIQCKAAKPATVPTIQLYYALGSSAVSQKQSANDDFPHGEYCVPEAFALRSTRVAQ
eukprot:scaffold111684_cov20-Prasinocladus_malaysianus.AAC.1